jgi:hypothetical protein
MPRFVNERSKKAGTFRCLRISEVLARLRQVDFRAVVLALLSISAFSLLFFFTALPASSDNNSQTMALAPVLKNTAASISPLFISHGAPTLPYDDVPARAFLKELGKRVAPAPKAILAVSAHWTTSEPSVSLAEAPETIHDFYGFPAFMYEVSQSEIRLTQILCLNGQSRIESAYSSPLLPLIVKETHYIVFRAFL